MSLGVYDLTPGGGPLVQLSNDANEYVIVDAIRLVRDQDARAVAADAIRLVANDAEAGSVLYVHADHLGTPQKMTDATGAVVWHASYTPFGRENFIIGAAANNQRFPGQYLDQETNLHYNYWRDYDPTTGRYVQSDPIGLAGGLNTYGYVEGNPVLLADPFGLYTEVIQWGAAPGKASRWGHVSGNINGGNWSFGPRGWDASRPRASDYAERQREPDIDRGGRGVILNLTTLEETRLEQCLAEFQNYDAVFNNCGNPWLVCLRRLNIVDPLDQPRVLPYDIFRILSKSPRALGNITYPGKSRPMGSGQ